MLLQEKSHAVTYLLLSAFGFKPEDFKIGKTDINIRPGKTHLLAQLYLELDKKSNEELAHKFKGSHKAYMRHVYFLGLRFLGSGQFTDIFYNKNISIRYLEFLVLLCGKRIVEKRSLLLPSTVHQNNATDKNLQTEDLHKLNIEQFYTENRSVTVDKEVKMENQTSKKVRTEKETKPTCAIRFDNMEHWIEFDDPNEERKSFRCKHCGAQATTFCTKCKVHLCFVREKKRGQVTRKIRNCFKAFHTMEES